MLSVSRQARAGNGAAGSAGRGRAQQLAAGQYGDPRPRAGLRQGEPVTQGHRSGPQGVERGGELIRAGLSGQGVVVKGDDGLDAHGPQAMGGGAGAPDPAAHRVVRDGELARDEPVPASLGGGDQGLADQGGAVGAARQQARSSTTWVTWQPVQRARSGRAVSRAPPSSRTVRSRVRPHGRRAAPQSGQGSLRRASASLAAAVSKTSSIVHPARFGPGRRLPEGGSWCCSLAPAAAWRNLTGLITQDPAPIRRRSRPPSSIPSDRPITHGRSSLTLSIS